MRMTSLAAGAIQSFQISVKPSSARVTGYTLTFSQTATTTTFV
jgi:hypothetical protein